MRHFGIKYFNNKKAWRRSGEFNRIIKTFFYHTRFTLKYPNVCLLMDNFSAHILPPEWKEKHWKEDYTGSKIRVN